MIFASLFGLSEEFDIYLVGAVIPLTINTIILYLAQNYLIPTYNNLKRHETAFDDNFLNVNYYLFVGGGFFIAVLLYLFSNSILNAYLPGIQNEKLNTVKIIFNIFLITIPINCASSILSAYQQLHFDFKHPAYSQLLLNISLIILIIIFTDTFGVYIIPVGYVFGSILQLLYLHKRTSISFKIAKFYLLFKEYRKFIPNTLIVIIIIESTSQLFLIADRYFYSYIPKGGIAALNYAQTIYLIPISILAIALSTAIFPQLANYISQKLTDDLERILNKSIMINVAIFVPITFIFLFYGDYFVKILFERGKFTTTDTLLVKEVLFYFSFSLIFYSVYSVINKVLYSVGLIHKLLYITIFGVIIKFILNYFLVHRYGQNGLALGTSFSYLFFFIVSTFLVIKYFKFKNKYVFIKEVFFQLTNAAISITIVKYLSIILPPGMATIPFEIMFYLFIYTVNIFIIKHPAQIILHKMIYSLIRRIQSKRIISE